MSYDLWLTQDGQPAEHADAELEWLNITYNLRPMFVRAVHAAGIPADENEGIRTIHGMTGHEAKCLVTKMVDVMEQYPAGYRALEPSNRWGTYESCIEFLRKVIAASDAHPNAKWGGD